MNYKFKKNRFMNVVFSMRKSHLNKNGNVPIYWYLSYNGQRSKTYSTGIRVNIENWRRNHATGHNAKPINDALDNLRADLTDVFNQNKNQISHIQEIADIYLGKEKDEPTFLELFDMLIERKVVEGKAKDTIRTYRTFRNIWLVPYLKSIDKEYLLAKHFTHIHLEGVYKKMLEAGKGGAYIDHSTSKVKAAIKLGYGCGILEKDAVASYSLIAPKKVKKYVFLEQSELQQLEQLTFLPKEKDLERVRDLFVLQCYTSLSYGELFGLSEKNLEKKNDWQWVFKRRIKTDIRQHIPLLPKAIELLRKLNFDTVPVKNKDYNDRIRICAKMAKITKYLHSHIARNTCGAYLLNEGISMEVVSRVLGHTNIRYTQRVYAKIIDTWRVKDEFDKVFRNKELQEQPQEQPQKTVSTGKMSFTYSYSN